MTRHEPRLRVQRTMAHRLTHEPPDSAWSDVAAVAMAIVLLVAVCLLAGVLPAVPRP